MGQDNNKRNILVSFSGGKTSAYMAQRIKRENKTDNLFFVFANTGQEREETLEFVERCDKEYGLNVVWVEAVVASDKGTGTRHKIVDFKTASRDGEPFESVMKKYGISNKSYPHCTRELKLAPINTWAKDNIKGEYKTVIGIRIDEVRRVKGQKNIEYPLIGWKIDKYEINEFWRKQYFTLYLEEHQGNCKRCFKKSLKKLIRLVDEDKSMFNFPLRMEREYSKIGCTDSTKRVFFRENRSTEDLFKIHANKKLQMSIFDFGVDDGCSESCEFIEAT